MKRSRLESRQSELDSGFTLIEVLVAVILLTVVTTASLYFQMTAQKVSADQQRREIAVTVANTVMEQVTSTNSTIDVNTAVGGDITTAVSGLYTGREKTQVQAAWAAYSSAGGVSLTNPTWDKSATSSSVQRVPIYPSPTTASGTVFKPAVLIGTCYRPMSSAAGTDCGLSAGAGKIAESRVMVIITWSPGSNSCGAGGCIYQTSTIIDTNADLKWVRNG